MCTSYAAPLRELSVSVEALSTVAPGFAATAAAETEDSVEPVSGVSPLPPEDELLPVEDELPLDVDELPLEDDELPVEDVAAVV